MLLVAYYAQNYANSYNPLAGPYLHYNYNINQKLMLQTNIHTLQLVS